MCAQGLYFYLCVKASNKLLEKIIFKKKRKKFYIKMYKLKIIFFKEIFFRKLKGDHH